VGSDAGALIVAVGAVSFLRLQMRACFCVGRECAMIHFCRHVEAPVSAFIRQAGWSGYGEPIC